MGLRQGLKNIAKDLSCHTGLARFLLQRYKACGKPALLVFRYHRVSGPNGKKEYMSTPRDMFEREMLFIKDNFKVTTMTEGLKAVHEDPSNGMYAAINFDDGYMDNYLHAFPVLKKYSIPATVFLTTDFIGKAHEFWWDKVFNAISPGYAGEREELADDANRVLVDKKDQEIESFIETLKKEPLNDEVRESSRKMLGWPEINEMAKSGVCFGGHTKTHRNLCLLDDDEAREELMGSKKIIEENTGLKVKEFSYPFGRFNERVRSLVIDSGYECARTSLKGINDKDTDRYSLVSIDTGSITKTAHLEMRIVSILLRRNRRT